MQNTPIHLNGPFTLKFEQGHHVISGRDGVMITELTGKLIDGSNTDTTRAKYPGGFIRTEQAREEEAKFVLDAMNARYQQLPVAVPEPSFPLSITVLKDDVVVFHVAAGRFGRADSARRDFICFASPIIGATYHHLGYAEAAKRIAADGYVTTIDGVQV